MGMNTRAGPWALLVVALLAGCGEAESPPPPPVEPDREAVTHFGRMILVDHVGPKAQVHLGDWSAPLWFSQVRDAVAYTLLPEESKDIAAIYVTDMAGIGDWDQTGPWIPAETAYYVLGSDRRGGMGALEAVPFGEREPAEAFAERHGGRVVRWDQIPRDYILDEAPTRSGRHDPAPGAKDHGSTH